MEPNPFKLISDACEFIAQGYQAWRGFRLMVFGVSGVGKSTLWQYLQTEQVVDTSSVEKTLDLTKLDKFKMKSIRLSWMKVAVLATDVPGDVHLRQTWAAALKAAKPNGVIYLIDNVPPGKPVPAEGYDLQRVAEHRVGFEYLVNQIIRDKEAADAIRALAVVVNKSDTLPNDVGYGSILEAAKITFPPYGELRNCRTTVFSCSALYGHNVTNMMRWMVEGMSFKL